MLRHFGLLLLAFVSTPAFCQNSLAGLFKDDTGTLHLVGVPPSSPVEFIFKDSSAKRSVTANPCGAIILSAASAPSSVTVAGTKIDTKSLPQEVLPRCQEGKFELPPRNKNFRSGSDQVVLTGFNSNQSVEIEYTRDRVRRVTANDCGVARISNSESSPIGGKFTVNNRDYDYASVPAGGPFICRNGKLFAPTK